MPKKYQPKDVDKILEELEGQSDRAAISVGGSFVEYALEQCIESRLREPQNETERSFLFADRGVIGTFFEKTWMAYFLKLIGPIARRDIDLIRKIRNEAAHNMNPVSFQTSGEISKRCRELEIAKDSIPAKELPQDLRGMFLVAVHMYTVNLLMRSADSNAQIAEAFEHLAPYLDQ
jgi:hypothetical protein